MKQTNPKGSNFLRKFGTAALGLFSGNQGPSQEEVKSSLDGARRETESLRDTRRHAAEVNTQTQKAIAQARELNGPQVS